MPFLTLQTWWVNVFAVTMIFGKLSNTLHFSVTTSNALRDHFAHTQGCAPDQKTVRLYSLIHLKIQAQTRDEISVFSQTLWGGKQISTLLKKILILQHKK